MAKILHHLSALGWGWTALFLLLDAVAIGCAVLAVMTKERRLSWRALLWSLLATVGVLASSFLAHAVGIRSAFQATEANPDPSLKARQLAEGISTAMNAVVLGMLFTGIAGVASLVCLVCFAARSRSSVSGDGRSVERPGT